MAVICTSMDMPISCYDCSRQFGCPYYKNSLTERGNNCPLKSADEMTAEIDKIAYTRTLTTNPFAQSNSKIVGYDSLMKVIHKYCDKIRDNEDTV